MFLACLFAVFYLVCASRSVALRCSDSVWPLDELDPGRLEGTWALVGASLTNPATWSSSSAETTPASTSITSDSTMWPLTLFSRQASIWVGKCLFVSYNVTLTGGVLVFDSPHEENISVMFLSMPCWDCVVMHTNGEPKTLGFRADCVHTALAYGTYGQFYFNVN